MMEIDFTTLPLFCGFLGNLFGSLFGSAASAGIGSLFKKGASSLASGLGNSFDKASGSFGSNIGDQLGSFGADKISGALGFGVPGPGKLGRNLAKFNKNAYPGTNPWEQMGAGQGGYASSLQVAEKKQQRRTVERTAKYQADSQVKVAKINAQSADNVVNKQTQFGSPADRQASASASQAYTANNRVINEINKLKLEYDKLSLAQKQYELDKVIRHQQADAQTETASKTGSAAGLFHKATTEEWDATVAAKTTALVIGLPSASVIRLYGLPTRMGVRSWISRVVKGTSKGKYPPQSGFKSRLESQRKVWKK